MSSKKVLGLWLPVIAAVALVAAACSAPAAPAPTAAPAAPKPAEPTKPAAPQPTAAPAAPQPTAVPAAKAPAYPEKGKTISMIVPFGAGGSTDIGARLLAAGMEKELGVPVQVVNKAGAGSQTGLTEIATSKPDGYTIGFANLPTANLVYTDPERKATFSSRTLVAPAGISKEMVDVLTAAMKKAMDAADHKQKMDESGLTLRYMDPAATASFWAETDKLAKALVDEARQK